MTESVEHESQNPRPAGGGGDIFERIQRGETAMRPRRYFTWRSLFLGFCTGIVFLLVIYAVSVTALIFRENGGWYALRFGGRGVAVLFSELPWGLLLMSLALTIMAVVLLWRYPVIYKRPGLYSIISLLILSGILGFVIITTPLKNVLLYFLPGSNVPVFGTLYQFESAPPSEIHRGMIDAFTGDGFIISDPYGVTSTVIVPAEVWPQLSTFQAGESVVVLGALDASGTVYAFGVEKAF